LNAVIKKSNLDDPETKLYIARAFELNKALSEEITGIQGRLNENWQMRQEVLGKKLKEFTQSDDAFKRSLLRLLVERQETLMKSDLD
jgi:hypothetical protein